LLEVEIIFRNLSGGNSLVRAKLDRAARVSIIKRDKAYGIGCAVAEDGRIRLRYYKKFDSRTQEEDFYVVEDATHDAILGMTSPLCRESTDNPQVLLTKLKPKNKGSYFHLQRL
jgi:hypothetical protein